MIEQVTPTEASPLGPSEYAMRAFRHASGKFPASDVHQAAWLSLAFRNQSSYFSETLRDALLADKTRLRNIKDTANRSHRARGIKTEKKSLYDVRVAVGGTFNIASLLKDVPEDVLKDYLSSFVAGDKEAYVQASYTAADMIEQYAERSANAMTSIIGLRSRQVDTVFPNSYANS